MEDINIAELFSEDTTPSEDSTVDSTDIPTEEQEDTTPNEADTGNDTDTSPTADETEAPNADESVSGTTTESPMLHIRYNHEDKHLSLDEAASFAQKGMAYESTMEALRSLAAASNQTVKDFVQNMAAAQEKSLFMRLTEECNGNEEAARRLMSVENDKIKSAVQKMMENEKAEHESDIAEARNRIGEQYEELISACTEIKEVKDIPQPVIKMAYDKKITLLDAYLRYQHKNTTAAKLAAEKAAEAAKATAGTMKSEKADGDDSISAALMKGLWG